MLRFSYYVTLRTRPTLAWAGQQTYPTIAIAAIHLWRRNGGLCLLKRPNTLFVPHSSTLWENDFNKIASTRAKTRFCPFETHRFANRLGVMFLFKTLLHRKRYSIEDLLFENGRIFASQITTVQ